MNKFKKVEIAENTTRQIVGGDCPNHSDCDGPITSLGTISVDGD